MCQTILTKSLKLLNCWHQPVKFVRTGSEQLTLCPQEHTQGDFNIL